MPATRKTLTGLAEQAKQETLAKLAASDTPPENYDAIALDTAPYYLNEMLSMILYVLRIAEGWALETEWQRNRRSPYFSLTDIFRCLDDTVGKSMTPTTNAIPLLMRALWRSLAKKMTTTDHMKGVTTMTHMWLSGEMLLPDIARSVGILRTWSSESLVHHRRNCDGNARYVTVVVMRTKISPGDPDSEHEWTCFHAAIDISFVLPIFRDLAERLSGPFLVV